MRNRCIYPLLRSGTDKRYAPPKHCRLLVNMAPKEVFDGSTDEDVALGNMGYEQEFKRSFGLLDMVGFSFSIVTW